MYLTEEHKNAAEAKTEKLNNSLLGTITIVVIGNGSSKPKTIQKQP